jgi:hypothetical protein
MRNMVFLRHNRKDEMERDEYDNKYVDKYYYYYYCIKYNYYIIILLLYNEFKLFYYIYFISYYATSVYMHWIYYCNIF